MRMRNAALILIVVFILISPALYAEHEHGRIYIGINPVAAFQFFGSAGAYITALGFISGAEFGAALYAGWDFTQGHALEARIATGPSNLVFWETQLQFGYLWYPCETFFSWNGGPLLGFFLRSFAIANELTGIWIFNHVPEIVVGWRFWINPVAIDIRAGWNICSFTWSTMSHSQPRVSWIEPPWGFNASVGVAIGFN